VIPMFVYGTLRRGGALELVYFDDDVRRERAILPGYRLYFAPHTNQYPVAVPNLGDDQGEIVGELIYAEHRAVALALQMEINAGYVATRVEPVVEQGAGHFRVGVPAVAAIWPSRRVGRRIGSGDWQQRWVRL
jgi:gamma-glutamylcyclotransferase (GGCT)/AIG2-like uncharacterized protein YtfP